MESSQPRGRFTMEKLLAARVGQFNAAHDLFAGHSPVLLGVSGGADSVCLLHNLSGLRQEFGIDLHVAHLNHGLRGDESDDDALYVTELATKLGIPMTIQKRDVAFYQKKNSLSEEEAAREVRYSFFAEVAQSIGSDRVAVGHTSNDQAETILMHMIRGTGLSGLRGMQPVSNLKLTNNAQLTVIRPLLELNREETESYCKKNNLSPRQDSSNISTKYLRNSIRSELIPILKKYNPNIIETLSRSTEMVADDMDYLSAETSKLWGTVINETDDGISIDNKSFNALPLSLKGHLLRSALEITLGGIRDISQSHIQSLIEILAKPSAGKKLSLPGGLFFHGGYYQSLICKDEILTLDLPEIEGEYKITVPGETSIPGWYIRTEITSNQGQSTNRKAFFDFDLVGQNLIVRPRNEGDRFLPLGMSSSKKIQDFLVDAKVPRNTRGRIPVVCAEDGIIWVAGYRIDERFKVTPATDQMLSIEFERR